MKKKDVYVKYTLCYSVGYVRKPTYEDIMDLREWLFRQRRTNTSLALELGCTRNYMGEIINRHKIPGKRLAADIERATSGYVTAAQLLDPQPEIDFSALE